jgi:hypothetical protein
MNQDHSHQAEPSDDRMDDEHAEHRPSGAAQMDDDKHEAHGKRADAVPFDTVLRAGNKGETLTALDLGEVEFTALNLSGVSGHATVARDGDHLTLSIDAEGLEPNQVHIQHIHGRRSADGMALKSNTPPRSLDADGDGFVELAEGAPAYGPILLNATTPPDAGLEGFPTAPDGKIRYEETFDLAAGEGLADGVTADQLFPLGLREMVIHGLSVDGSAGAGTPGEIDGTAGYKLVLPVASGEIEAVGSKLIGGRGDDHLTGAMGDDTLRGGRGDDTMRGEAGNDLMQGGEGDDEMHGGAGADRLVGASGWDRMFGGAGIDQLLGGGGSDELWGDSGASTGRGDLSADVLVGGAGNDTLHIGEGLDVARGGSGEDSFAFRFNDPLSPAAAGTAAAFVTLEDFNPGQDKLVFDAAGLGEDAESANFIDGSGGMPGGQPASFFSGAAAHSDGEAVMVLTGQAFASGALAVQTAQNEEAGDIIVYFNSTVNVASLLVVSAPDTAGSIARFTDITSLDQLQASGFSASDFIFA